MKSIEFFIIEHTNSILEFVDIDMEKIIYIYICIYVYIDRVCPVDFYIEK